MIEKEKIASILSRDTWEEVMNGLDACGLSYIRKGGGAVIRSETEKIKASEIGRQFSLFHMGERLGPLPSANAEAGYPCLPIADDDVFACDQTDSSLEYVGSEAASLRFRIFLAAMDGDAEELERLCGDDPEAAYYADRFQWLVDKGKKALPNITPCEMWIRQAHLDPIDGSVPLRELFRQPNDKIVNDYLTECLMALEADSYQIICSSPDGRNMRYHEMEGYPEGIPENILPKFFERLMRLNERGEMIALKPQSNKYHYIFIQNVTPAGVEMLLNLGIDPAYVQEISEDMYQVIVKIPKIGNLEADKAIVNDISRALNLIAGDCLPGSKRSHYAHSFTNWRGAEKDGMSPVSGGILAEYGKWRFANKSTPLVDIFEPQCEPGQADGMALYNAHLDDILRITCQKLEEADRSELDMEIAIRLCDTGHSEQEVAAILAEAGRRSGLAKPDWDAYAAITAHTAFSDDRILMKFAKWNDKWRSLELRAVTKLFRADAMT